MCEKTPADALKDELFYSPEHAAFTCEDGEIETADSFCGDYIEGPHPVRIRQTEP